MCVVSWTVHSRVLYACSCVLTSKERHTRAQKENLVSTSPVEERAEAWNSITVRQSDKEDNSGCYAHKMSTAAIQQVTI